MRELTYLVRDLSLFGVRGSQLEWCGMVAQLQRQGWKKSKEATSVQGIEGAHEAKALANADATLACNAAT